MQLFARVLVPLDFSGMTPGVVGMALRLLSPEGEATLLHVVETLPAVMEGAYGVFAHRRETEEVKRLSLEKLGQIAQEHQASVRGGGRLTPLVREGKPANEIIAAAEELRSELIVIGSHGRSGLEHLLVGSVTERVLRKSRCHVFVVRG